MQNYDFLLNAAQPVALMQAAGVNVYYKTGVEAAGLTGVRVKGEGGGLDIVLLPGEGIRLPTEQSRFTLTRADASAADVAGTMLIGNAEFSASRVQGDVSILNGAGLAAANAAANYATQLEQRIVAGLDEPFLAMNWSGTGASVGSHHGVRLRNPVGSGRVLIMDEVLIQRTIGPSSGYIFGSIRIVATTTDFATGIAPALVSDFDGSAGVAICTKGTDATTAANVGYEQQRHLAALPGVYQHAYKCPAVVMPGFAITAAAILASSGENVTARFQYRERLL